jgi:hypothetical protein
VDYSRASGRMFRRVAGAGVAGLRGRRVPHCLVTRGSADARAGPGGGKDGGAGGDLGGTLAAVGKGAPVVSPRPGVSRPLAVL